MLKVIKGYPPNIENLRLVFPITEKQLFPYGDKLYDPTDGEIPPDIMFHEQVHSEQQGNNPEAWWHQYMMDRDFRLSQEVEAYHKQYQFVKTVYNNKEVKECLDELSDNLSSDLYKLNINKYQASTLIRKWKKSTK